MALKVFKNKGEEGAMPLNAENLNYNFQEVLNMLCPVGKVEIFFDNNDHSNYLGFKWERTSIGKVPVGINSNDSDFNTIGKTGGEKTHQLTIAEIPSHNHEQNGSRSSGSSWCGTFSPNLTTGNPSVYTFNTGGDQPHNNLQPYEVMAFWKRIA